LLYSIIYVKIVTIRSSLFSITGAYIYIWYNW